MDIHGSTSETSHVAQVGRRLERCASLLWEGMQHRVLRQLSWEGILPEAAVTAREQGAEAIEAMQATLDPTLWRAFAAAADAVEEALRATKADTAAPPRTLPPGVAQLQPLVEAYFLFGESARAAHAPTEVLAAEALAARAGDLEELAPGSAANPAAGSLPSWRSHSQLQLGSQSQLNSLTGQSQGAGPSSPSRAPPPAAAADARVYRFAERHRQLINLIVHSAPSLLQGSMALLMRAPKLLDFENK